eukprot:CAMPEP_0205921694 /NCGR_PEP_ID=MMETSP1325-20131115/13264_1 /ASSEMBLY_ACC=CAM_ASM_000708 /TAXON_ID=236786 /ORGANISM="Florenciella sp., Strain RCC1007" /LENGTH=118 /DNA_ID=CAMNT_0053289579 /DNA_START=85 /DNA_END=441 /DNA_ORIENTATION=-
MADSDDEEHTGGARVSTRKITVHRMELTEEMVKKAVEKVDIAMDSNAIEKDIATAVKVEFDKEYGGTWHCVVGRHFGCSVTHETKYLVFFQVDQMYALLFCSDEPTNKEGVDKASAAK